MRWLEAGGLVVAATGAGVGVCVGVFAVSPDDDDDGSNGVMWMCHICGELRPDEVIGVTHQPVEGCEHLFPGTMRFNVRHCTDRPVCVLIASRPDWQDLRLIR